MSGRVRFSRSGSPLTSLGWSREPLAAEVRLGEPAALQEHTPGAVEDHDALGEELLQPAADVVGHVYRDYRRAPRMLGWRAYAVRPGVEPPGGASVGRGRLRAMSQGAADILGRGPGRLGGALPEQLPRRTVRQNAQSLGAVPLFTGFSTKHLKSLASQTRRAVVRAARADRRGGDARRDALRRAERPRQGDPAGPEGRRGAPGRLLRGALCARRRAAVGDGDRRDADAGAAAVPSHAPRPAPRGARADPEAARRDRATDARGPAPRRRRTATRRAAPRSRRARLVPSPGRRRRRSRGGARRCGCP